VELLIRNQFISSCSHCSYITLAMSMTLLCLQ